jgi:hypothetical protein
LRRKAANFFATVKLIGYFWSLNKHTTPIFVNIIHLYFINSKSVTMRSFTISFFFLLLGLTTAFAQNRHATPVQVIRSGAELTLPSNGDRGVADTLASPAFTIPGCNTGLFIWTIGSDGFILGTNSYGDKEKAQRLDMGMSANATVSEVWGWFIFKAVNSDPSVSMKVYDINPSNLGPNTLLGTSNLAAISSVDTSGLPTIFNFSFPPAISDTSFFVSFDFSSTGDGTGGDTLVLAGTNTGCSLPHASWEKWSDDNWFELDSVYTNPTSINISMYTAAVVDIDTAAAGIEDAFISSHGLTVFPAYPNPSNGAIKFNFELDKASPVKVEIYSTVGQLLRTIDYGVMTSGEHVMDADLSELAAGNYVYGVITPDARLMTRFSKIN